MCGIVGYAGEVQAAPVLLSGLEKLEYRGYDSRGWLFMTERPCMLQRQKDACRCSVK